METGQMNLIQLPIEATLLTTVTGSSQAQPAQAGEQDSRAFAALLAGIIQQAPAQSTVVAGAVPAEILSHTVATVEAMPLVVMDVKPETLFTFITTSNLQLSDKVLAEVTPEALLADKVIVGATPVVQLSDKKSVIMLTPAVQLTDELLAEAAPALQLSDNAFIEPTQVVQLSDKVPAAATRTERSEKDVEIKQTKDAISQEVLMNAAWVQAVPTLQMGNRMPESGRSSDVRIDPETNGELPVVQTSAPIASEMPLRQIMEANPRSAATAAITQSLALSQETQRPVEVVTAQAATEAPVIPQAQASPEGPSMPQSQPKSQAPAILRAPQAPASATHPVSSFPESTVSSVISAPAIPAAKLTTPAVSRIPLQQIMEAYSTPFSASSGAPAVEAALVATVVATIVEQRPVKAVTAEATPVEIPPGQYLDAAFTVSKDEAVRIAAVPVKHEEETEKPTPVPVQVVATIPEQPQEEVTASPVEHAIETGAIPTKTVVKTNNGRAVVQEEQFQQQIPVNTVVKTKVDAGNVLPGAVKAVDAATTDEDFLSGDKSPSDQAMNGQLHQVSQQRIKTDTVVAPPVVTVATSGVAEQVVKQVSDHFAKHEIKTGSEQIVLRLSPENLGELKVNMKMENQRLTVEIVTENRMVRDAILQNSDTLKESLAKQNIKMDSFNVSSGSNGNDGMAGRNGRNQNEWQELTRNRQANQWLQGGYDLPKDFIPQKLAYNQQAEYGMLNVHF